jgi:hypothetical protein
LAAFLAFLFFAITSLRQKLKKQAQRPSGFATGDSTVGWNPPANLLSPEIPSDSENFFHASLAACTSTQREKFVSSIAHNLESSKKYLAAKPRRI